MKYRVVFRERVGLDGEKSDDPPSFLDNELDDETVLDARFVGRLQPESQHNSEELEEDDAFLSVTSEIWEYEVAEGRDEAFVDAFRNSGVVIEFEPLESADELGVG